MMFQFSSRSCSILDLIFQNVSIFYCLELPFIERSEKNYANEVICQFIVPQCIHKQKRIVDVDKTLKSVVKRQIPFLIGGTITGTIMTYYYGFPFTIIVNSIIWWVISYLVNKYYWKSTGLNDQKYLLQYAMSKIKSRKKKN
jgi:hypothetical protein